MHSAECMWVFVGNLETWKELACSATAYLRKVCSHGGFFCIENILLCFYLIKIDSIFLAEQLPCITFNCVMIYIFTRGHVEP